MAGGAREGRREVGARFTVRLGKQAAKSYERLDAKVRNRVDDALEEMERNPRPAGKKVKAIQGSKDRFLRRRIGDYRVMYEVLDDEKVVLILGIVPRSDLEAWLRRQRRGS